MSPRRSPEPTPEAADAAATRVSVALGLAIREARTARGWKLRGLAKRAGVTVGSVHNVEAGIRATFEMYARLAAPLGLRLEAELVDTRVLRQPTPRRDEDPVHATMGELEAGHLRGLGYEVAIDEPYQHYQYAGRGDVVAWSVAARALLHIENKTRFPNVGDAAGAWNAKRAYLGPDLAARHHLRAWQSVTHVMVCLWSNEYLHALRLRPDTFRSLAPDSPNAFHAWWSGNPPERGTTATLVLLDPFASGQQRQVIDLATALLPGTRPRLRGYADAVGRISQRTSSE